LPPAASPPSGEAPAGAPPELAAQIRFPEPTADPEAIERLLLAKLERTPPPAAVERIELELAGASPAAGQQLPLFVPQALHGARLAWQLARLSLTYGDEKIRRIEILDPEAPLPERRWAYREVADTTAVSTSSAGSSVPYR
jgi:hypothetical protein